MVTVWFEANGLRPDVARFRGRNAVAEAEAAIVNLVHKRFAHVPLRIRATHGGRVVYQLDRPGAGEA